MVIGAQSRDQDLELGKAIDSAAGRLPNGWTIELQIECGSVIVVLDGPNGSSHVDFMQESLADQINEAVEYAVNFYSGLIFIARKGNVVRRADGTKYVAAKDHETAKGCQLISDQPHSDGDFSYTCGSEYCRCIQ